MISLRILDLNRRGGDHVRVTRTQLRRIIIESMQQEGAWDDVKGWFGSKKRDEGSDEVIYPDYPELEKPPSWKEVSIDWRRRKLRTLQDEKKKIDRKRHKTRADLDRGSAIDKELDELVAGMKNLRADWWKQRDIDPRTWNH